MCKFSNIGSKSSHNSDGHLPCRVLPADLQRHDVPRKQATYSQRLGCQKHPRIFKGTRQNLRLRSVPRPWSWQRLLSGKIQVRFTEVKTQEGLCVRTYVGKKSHDGARDAGLFHRGDF